MALHNHSTQLDVSSSVHRFLQSLGEITKPQDAWWDLRAAMHILSPQGKLIVIQMADTNPHAEEHTNPQKTFDLMDIPSDWQRNLGKVLLQEKKPFLIFHPGEEIENLYLWQLSSETKKVLS